MELSASAANSSATARSDSCSLVIPAVRDYLRTNEYLKEDIVFLTGYIKTQVPEGACVNEEALRNLFGARPEYIETYYGRIRERFGGVPHFLREGLHLSLKDIATLRERYLE